MENSSFNNEMIAKLVAERIYNNTISDMDFAVQLFVQKVVMPDTIKAYTEEEAEKYILSKLDEISPEARKKRIHIICPVRNVTEEQQAIIDRHCSELEALGYEIHNPIYAVEQDDPDGGINICRDHLASIMNPMTKEVHVFWDSSSKGSHFDLGMVFALGKPVKPIDIFLGDTAQKSYTKVLLSMKGENYNKR